LQTVILAAAGALAMPFAAGMKLGDAMQKAVGMDGLSEKQSDYADKAFKAFPRGIKNLLSNGSVLPPAIGPIVEVPSIDNTGNRLSNLNPKQHSITFLINGIEHQKTQDVFRLS
jgi:hypothetical protein